VTDVRAATIEDCDAIARVHVASWRESYRGLIPQPVLDALSVPERKLAWQKVIAGLGKYPVHVAEDEGRIAGFAQGGACRGEALGQEMEVYAIYLLARAQHRGIGGKLLKTVMSDFIADGRTSAGLWVMRDNAIARNSTRNSGPFPSARGFRVGPNMTGRRSVMPGPTSGDHSELSRLL
jgi:L-amino acid N-acyltransferase YncA